MRKSCLSIGSAALALLMLATSVPSAQAASFRPEQPVAASSDISQVRDSRYGDSRYGDWRYREWRHRDWRRGDWRWRHHRSYYDGYRGHDRWRHGYRHHRGYWIPGAAFGTGLIIGGAIASQPRYRVRSGLPRGHVEYCMQRYRSYRVWDDSYQPNYGPRRRCMSPYY